MNDIDRESLRIELKQHNYPATNQGVILTDPHVDYLIDIINKKMSEAEISLARKVLGVSSMVYKQRGVTQSMRLKHLTEEMFKIIPDSNFGIDDYTDFEELEDIENSNG